MKLEVARGHYYEFSGRLSDVTRQLCFAGIAVVWILTGGDSGGVQAVVNGPVVPLVLFVIALAFDLLHYAVATFSWGILHRWYERFGSADTDDVAVPRWINWTPIAMFWGKVTATISAYLILAPEVFR